jgi:hypothetical protein
MLTMAISPIRVTTTSTTVGVADAVVLDALTRGWSPNWPAPSGAKMVTRSRGPGKKVVKGSAEAGAEKCADEEGGGEEPAEPPATLSLWQANGRAGEPTGAAKQEWR